jgi:predicted Zn-dependent protease
LTLISRLLAGAIFAFMLTSCAINLVTGKQEFSLVSAQQEVAIGAKQYHSGQQTQGGLYYIDPGVQTYINEVGQKLARVSDRPQLPYEFVVLNNSVPNAWALPGGKIAINRGLLTLLEDESELAAVLSHEIVHAAARHGASQMTRGMLAGIGLQALGTATNNNALGGLAAQLGTSAWIASYGRSAELESDTYGMAYMVRAGYDPHGAVMVQKKFLALSKDRQQNFMGALFASHPPSQERVSANQAKAQTYPTGGLKYRQRFTREMSRIKQDRLAYKAQDKAIKALQAKEPRKALDLLDESIRIQAREGQFWELRGHAWKMLDKQNKAIQAFSTAVKKNPNYFSHYLARGVQYFERGKTPNAQSDLEKSRQLLPTPLSSLYLGDIAAAKDDKQSATSYYREAAAAPGQIGKEAKARLAALNTGSSLHQTIASGLSLGSDGYLRLHIHNKNQTAVSGVVVQISEQINNFLTGPPAYVEIEGSVLAGAQRVLKTRIGPLSNAEAVLRYRALVIKAKSATGVPN